MLSGSGVLVELVGIGGMGGMGGMGGIVGIVSAGTGSVVDTVVAGTPSDSMDTPPDTLLRRTAVPPPCT